MIRKLNVVHIDRVISAANNNTLTNVVIYKAGKGKNLGAHMIEYNIDGKDVTIPSNVIKDDVYTQFIRSIRQIRQHVVNNDFKTIDFSYNVDTRDLKYRFVGTE